MTELPMWGLGWEAWLLPILLFVPGLGFARRFRSDDAGLGLLIDSAWIGMAITWLNVALVREAGISPEHHLLALSMLAVAWTVVGFVWSRGQRAAWVFNQSARIGTVAVLLAVVGLSLWRSHDIARPLHGHWHLDGADEWRHEALPLSAQGAERHGWADAGAFSVIPVDGRVLIRADEPALGRLTLAVQGPIGSRMSLDEHSVEVQSSVTVREAEGPVRRYLAHGVAGFSLDIDVQAGETLTVETTGERIFVLPGADAVWSLHAAGVLRFVHYYQLLNQVENQVWAQEMLQDRWATLNQPPGWSPLLTTATVLLVDDMQSAAWLFLWVLILVGFTAVRLAVVLVPGAHPLAMVIPAGMVLSHGLLMFEPASYNFPDSLYAAAVLAVALAIAEQRVTWIAWMGIAAGLLRWPGVIVSSIFVLVYWRIFGLSQWRALSRMWQLVAVGAVLAVIGSLTGKLEDLLFILYFETFPEHWHGDYAAKSLIPRVPGFYTLWTAYTGGGLLFALAGCWGREGHSRRALRWLMTATLIYSAMLATIDHHPTHYFLPLVALTGVALVCASDSFRSDWMQWAVPALTLLGLGLFLWTGDVGLQPVENMVLWFGELLA